MRKILILLLVFGMQKDVMTKKMKPTDLDFWTGKWECYSADSLIGQNHVSKILNDKVVMEDFMTFNDGFTGRSWSVFDSSLAVWKQTWVDNSGAYMLFTGALGQDSLFFIEDNSVTINGQKHYRRMIFYSIRLNSFEWKWQSSIDKSEWKTNWHLVYKRIQN